MSIIHTNVACAAGPDTAYGLATHTQALYTLACWPAVCNPVCGWPERWSDPGAPDVRTIYPRGFVGFPRGQATSLMAAFRPHQSEMFPEQIAVHEIFCKRFAKRY